MKETPKMCFKTLPTSMRESSLIVFNYTSLPAAALGCNLSKLTFSFAFTSSPKTETKLNATTNKTTIFFIFLNRALIHSLWRTLCFIWTSSYANVFIVLLLFLLTKQSESGVRWRKTKWNVREAAGFVLLLILSYLCFWVCAMSSQYGFQFTRLSPTQVQS